MSLDARYLFCYDTVYGKFPDDTTPIERDIKFIEKEFGGKCEILDHGLSVYYDKPKYTLDSEAISYLYADQVLEKQDCDRWKIIKG